MVHLALAVSKPGKSFGLAILADLYLYIIGNLSSANQCSFKQLFSEFRLVALFYLTSHGLRLVRSIFFIISAFIRLVTPCTDSASFVC